MEFFIFYVLFSLILNKIEDNNPYNESLFFTTWGTAVNATEAPPTNLQNNSISQIVHISATGEKIRLKL